MTALPIGVAIVDDDPGFSAAFAELLDLEPELQLIGVAGSVEQAIELLADRRVELAFVDVHMPDGGGLRVIEEVRSWGEQPAVMLISANPSTSDTRRSGLRFLSKQDIDPGVLLRAAREAPRR